MDLQKMAQLAQNIQPQPQSGPGFLGVFMTVTVAVLVVISVFGLIAAVLLTMGFSKYRHQANSLGRTGAEIARQLLDEQELKKIKVASSGSILWGSSYSPLLKKVRLGRLAYTRKSLWAMAVAVQKACLAVLDQQDRDAFRARRTGVMYLGPLALLPLMIVGALLEWFLSGGGWIVFSFTVLALVLYAISWVAAIRGLAQEKRAQAMALERMEADGYATAEEQKLCRKLYRLCTAEYLNNMVLGILELLYRVLQVFTYIQGSPEEDAP